MSPHKPSARGLALEVLYQVETTGVYADHALEQLWQRVSIADDRDRRLIIVLVYGVLQWKKRIDWVLDQFVKGGTRRLDPWTRNILRMGVFQLLFLDRIPASAAIHEAVELAKQKSGRGAGGLVNAVLRNIVRNHDRIRYPALEEDPILHIAVVYSHPEWLVRRWVARYGVEDTIALCQFNNTPRPLTLRVNRLRATVERVQQELEAEGVASQPGLYVPYSLRLTAGVDVTTLSVYQRGWVQVQDEAATLVGLLVDPQPGEYVIDMCAAPGGKTTHLAELMDNQGRILAVDLHARRLQQLVENCQRLGITIVQPQVGDATQPLEGPPADRVLVDAPCSGLGVLARRRDARWHKSEADILALQDLQKRLLRAAAKVVKPGGRLVYSTCTLEPEENDAVVEGFLEQQGAAFELVPAWHTAVPAALVDEKGYYRALPHRHQIDGAFGAIFVKKESKNDE